MKIQILHICLFTETPVFLNGKHKRKVSFTFSEEIFTERIKILIYVRCIFQNIDTLFLRERNIFHSL